MVGLNPWLRSRDAPCFHRSGAVRPAGGHGAHNHEVGPAGGTCGLRMGAAQIQAMQMMGATPTRKERATWFLAASMPSGCSSSTPANSAPSICSPAALQWPSPGLNATQRPASIAAPMAAMIRFSAKLTTPRGVLEFPPTQAQLRAR
jgi:hypothetical protein